MSFSERLRLSRENKGLTQQQISDMLNIPRTTYSGYESTSKREPDFQTLILISDLLETSLDYLIKGEEKLQDNVFLDRQITLRLNELEKEYDRIQQKLDERKAEVQDIKKLVSKGKVNFIRRGGFSISQRNELLRVAVQNYIYYKVKSVVYQREESSEYKYASGYLNGVCTAYEVDYDVKETDGKIFDFCFFHQKSGRKFLKIQVETE